MSIPTVRSMGEYFGSIKIDVLDEEKLPHARLMRNIHSI